MHVYIDNNRIVRGIFPDFDPAFPGIPIERRYTADFLSRCLEVPDDAAVADKMEYLPLENIFVWPIRFTGATRLTTPTEAVTIPVAFSVPGAWEISRTSIEGVQTVDDGVEIPANATGTVEIKFTADESDREMTVTIEVIPLEEPTPEQPAEEITPSEAEQLRAENRKLASQIAVMETQQTFLEDCLLELADEVYA